MKELSTEEYLLIDRIIQSDNCEKIIKELITKFAYRDGEHANALIAFNNSLLKVLNDVNIQKINKMHTALWMSIIQQSFKNKKDNTYFCTVLPVCQEYFPNGITENMSGGEKEYFVEFLKLLKNNYDCERDKKWATQYHYDEYLKLIISKYFDENGEIINI